MGKCNISGAPRKYPFCHWAFVQGFPFTLKCQIAKILSFPLCFLNSRNAPAALCLEQISIAVPAVVALIAVGTSTIFCNPTEKVWTLNLSCCYFNVSRVGWVVCVYASSLLLQVVFVHLPCSFVPFIPSSSSTFLPGSFLQSNPCCIFPGLSFPFHCLVLGDFSSLPLLSHPFLLPALGLTFFF